MFLLQMGYVLEGDFFGTPHREIPPGDNTPED